MVCFFVILLAPAAAAAAAAISSADRSLDFIRAWLCSTSGAGADLVLTVSNDVVEISSEELFDDSVGCLWLFGRSGDRIGDVSGRDLTLVGVRLRS